ncbi:MAG: hypothetical protein B5M51_07985, partial [Anaerolinea sp. 4484_236]
LSVLIIKKIWEYGKILGQQDIGLINISSKTNVPTNKNSSKKLNFTGNSEQSMSQPIKAKISQKFNLRSYLSQWLNQRKMSEPITISLTALIVGIGAGLGAVVFRRLISFFRLLL